MCRIRRSQRARQRTQVMFTAFCRSAVLPSILSFSSQIQVMKPLQVTYWALVAVLWAQATCGQLQGAPVPELAAPPQGKPPLPRCASIAAESTSSLTMRVPCRRAYWCRCPTRRRVELRLHCCGHQWRRLRGWACGMCRPPGSAGRQLDVLVRQAHTRA